MKKKDPRDGNHGRRGIVGGNYRYNRARLRRFLSGYRTGDLYPRKVVTMGKN